MKKRPFILSLGVGWSGTTSLYYTLHNNLKYVHSGFLKENEYLDRYYRLYPDKKKYLEEINCDYFFTISQKLFSGKYNDSVLSKFSESELFSFFGPNLSLQKYLNYYLKLSEYCGNKYTAVGDFSNVNVRIKKNTMKEIKSLLENSFDIKILFIFRDLIRREWSQRCSHNLSNKNSMFVIKSKNNDGKVIRPLTSDSVVDAFKKARLYNYAEKVNAAYDVFGKENVHYIIMEDFFKEQKNNLEVIKLEKFLDIKISPEQIYPCNFVPDRGVNSSRLGDLSDQWTSDHIVLPPEFYNTMRNRKDYFDAYSKFKQLHGFLPADWGHPIDYGY